jgi:hypothetical protein
MDIPRVQLFQQKPPQRIMSEEDVKRLLGIKDFRHLSKKQVISFISSIPQMDPEVAKKVIDQFPQMADMAVDLAKEYRAALDSAMKANDASAKDAAATIDKVIDALSDQLNKDDLTAEERVQIVNAIGQVTGYKLELHKANQEFLLQGLKSFGIFMVSIVAIGVSVTLGGKESISLPSMGNDEDKKL